MLRSSLADHSAWCAWGGRGPGAAKDTTTGSSVASGGPHERQFLYCRVKGARGCGASGLALALLILVQAPTAQAAASASAGPIGSISGTVTRDGAAVSGGTVLIRVLPNHATMHAAASGTALSLLTVATATTDSLGRFGVTPTAIPAGSLDPDGTANFVASVSDGASTLNWSFGLKASPQSTTATTASANVVGAPSAPRRAIGLRIDVGKNSGVDETDNPAANWQGQSAGRLTSAGLISVPTTKSQTISAGVAAPAGVCGPWLYATSTTKKVNEGFANAWSWTGAKVNFEESSTSSHTLGVAAQDSGGGWSVNGSYTWTETTSSGGTKAALWDNYLENQVNYREYYYPVCVGGTNYVWYPDSVASLLYPVLGWSHSVHPNWASHGCGVYGSGDNMWKSSGTNVTMAAGVSFGPISLSAQAGWNSDIKEDFIFTQTSDLCGSSNLGWASAPQAEAHQY